MGHRIPKTIERMRAYTAHDTYRSPYGEPIEPPSSEKELIIFAMYLSLGNVSQSKANQILQSVGAQMKSEFDELEEKTNFLIKFFIFPIREGNTKLECVFSSGNNSNQSNIDTQKLLDIINSKQPSNNLDDDFNTDWMTQPTEPPRESRTNDKPSWVDDIKTGDEPSWLDDIKTGDEPSWLNGPTTTSFESNKPLLPWEQ